MINFVIILFLLSDRKSHATSRIGHLKPIGSSGEIFLLKDDLDSFPRPDIFYKEYIRLSRPVIIRGGAKSSPAYKLWTDDYIRSKIPPNLTAQDQLSVESDKKENRDGKPLFMTLRDYLDQYNSSNIYLTQNLPAYLQSDIILPWSIQCDEYKKTLETAMLWFSSGGTKSVLHSDGSENINCLYRGRKRMILIDTIKYWMNETSIVDIPDGKYSSVDVDAVDLMKFPALEGLEFWEANLNTGDCIYIPQTWIHFVESYESNLAVNIWWQGLIRAFTSHDFDMKTCSPSWSENNTLDKYSSVFFDPEGHYSIVKRFIFKSMGIIWEAVKERVFHTENVITKESFIHIFLREFNMDKEMFEDMVSKMFDLLDTKNKDLLNKNFDITLKTDRLVLITNLLWFMDIKLHRVNGKSLIKKILEDVKDHKLPEVEEYKKIVHEDL